MFARVWIIVAALLGASGVGMGAFRAHGLKKFLIARGTTGDELQKALANCATAVDYQLVSALALLLVGALAMRYCARLLHLAAALLAAGAAGFSGGLYCSVFGVPLHFSVIPIGGLMMILGWLSIAAAGLFSLRDADADCSPAEPPQ